MTTDQLLWRVTIFISRIAEFFSSQKHLFSARYAFLHELVSRSIHKSDITKKNPAIFLAVGKFDRVLCVRPRETQQELTNVFLEGKTRIGKGLNIETNSLTWPHPLIANDIKEELWWRTAGFRKQGLGGKSFKFDPRGNGARYDPLEGKHTEFELQSAAAILLSIQAADSFVRLTLISSQPVGLGGCDDDEGHVE